MHDRGGFNPVQSMKLAKEALVVLALPKKMTTILPGHGWRPPELNVVKINTDGGLLLDAHKGGAGDVIIWLSFVKQIYKYNQNLPKIFKFQQII
jgi:hypothetical protein